MMIGVEAKSMDQEPKSVHIDKIKNGYLIKLCGPYSNEEAEFTKDLYKSGSIVARLFGVNGKKNAKELSRYVKNEKDREIRLEEPEDDD